MGSIRILHVDDEPSLADLTAEYLTLEDDRFEVITETNASDGLERLQEAAVDGIVSDFQMPGTNGLEFLRAVRDEYPDLPFILFTGKGSEEIASKAISAGVTDYLQKESGTGQYTILANRLANAVERYRAVRQTDLSYRAMETAGEGISLVDSDGTFSYVNPAFANLFGYDPDELVGKHWKVLYHNEEAERLEHDILPAVPDTGYWAGETVRLTKDGERLVTDHRLAYTEEGVIVCTAQDVTTERTTLAEPRTGIDMLVDTVDEYSYYTLDHEGYITQWNEASKQLKGYGSDEIIGTHIEEFFTTADRKAGLPEQLLETAKSEGSVSDEGWRLRKDGSQFWAAVTISAIYDDAGTIRGYGKLTREAEEPMAA